MPHVSMRIPTGGPPGKANVDQCDKWGRAPVDAATKNGHHETLLRLIDVGADINRAATDGSTALHRAAEGGLLRMAQTLLIAGSQVNAAQVDGQVWHTTVCIHIKPEMVSCRNSNTTKHATNAKVVGGNEMASILRMQ